MLTRDDAAYWDRKPDDHNVVGLFVIGPQEARPSLFFEIETGNANKAPEVESRDAILARELELKAARLRRMGIAISGRQIGRNRKRKAA